MGDRSPTTNEIVLAMQRRHTAVQASTTLSALDARKGPAVYVALGPSALAAGMRSEMARPLLSLFVSSQSFARITDDRERRARGKPVTAIYAEASPESQMQLIRAMYARRVTVGVLLSQATLRLVEPLQNAARTTGLDIEVRVLDPGENVLRALAGMASINVLLTVPDREIYTPDTVRAILESTYRRGQAVIGFSTDMVAAGALAAAYSNIDDVVAQVGDISDSLAQGRWVEPQYPNFWRVAVNESVARSMNIVLDPNVRLLGNLPPQR